MFVSCGIWCLADVSNVSPSSEQTAPTYTILKLGHNLLSLPDCSDVLFLNLDIIYFHCQIQSVLFLWKRVNTNSVLQFYRNENDPRCILLDHLFLIGAFYSNGNCRC